MPGSRSLRLKRSKKQGSQRSGQNQGNGANADAGAGSAKGPDKPGRIHVRVDPPAPSPTPVRDGEHSRPRPQPIEPVTTTVHTSEGIGGALASALRILGLKAVPLNDASTPAESNAEPVTEQQKLDEAKEKAVTAASAQSGAKHKAARPSGHAHSNARPDEKARPPIRAGAPLPPVLQNLTTYGMSTAGPSQQAPPEDDSNVATVEACAGIEADNEVKQSAASPSQAEKVQESMKQLSEVHELVKQAVQAFASVMKKAENAGAGPSTEVFVTPPETPVVHDAVEVESQSAVVEDTGDGPESLLVSENLTVSLHTQHANDVSTAAADKDDLDNGSEQHTAFTAPDQSPLVYHKPYNGLPEHSWPLIASYLADQRLQKTLANLSQTCKGVYRAVLPKLYERRSLCPRTLAPLVLPRGTEQAREWYTDERYPARAALLPTPDVRLVRQLELLGYARRLYIDIRLPVALEQLLHMRANRERTFAQVCHIDLGADFFAEIAYNVVEGINSRSYHMFLKMLNDSFAPKIRVCASPRVSRAIARYRELKSESDEVEPSDDGPGHSSPEISVHDSCQQWGLFLRTASRRVLDQLCKMDCIESLTLHDLRPGEPVAIHRYGETVLDFRPFLRVEHDNVPLAVVTSTFMRSRYVFLHDIATLIRDLPDDWSGKIVFRNIAWLVHPTSDVDQAIREWCIEHPNDRGTLAGHVVQRPLGHEALYDPIFVQRCRNNQFVVLDDTNHRYYCETCQSFPEDPDANGYPRWF